MIHARDSFRKHLVTKLSGTGVPLESNPDNSLVWNALNVLFMRDVPLTSTNPAEYELVTSLDIMVKGDASAVAERKAVQMAMTVNGAISGGWIKKQNWSNPASPVDLGTFIWWRPWYDWRRVPEPEERNVHLNRTLSLHYTGQRL